MFSQERCVAGASKVVTYTPIDAEGEPSGADPGPVTVNVTRADGTAIATGAATTGTGVTPRTYQLAATAVPDQITVTWLVSSVPVHYTTVDIVGGVFLTLAELYEREPTLSETTKFPPAVLQRARREVEAMIDRATSHVLSFVPKFAVTQDAYLSRGDVLQVPHAHVRSVRWASYVDASGVSVAVDVTAGVGVYPDGTLRLHATSWPSNRMRVGYVHGLTAPDDEVKRAVARAVRRQAATGGVDPRAISHSIPGGEIQRFPTPGLGPWITGLPEVDEVLQSYRERYVAPGIA